MRELTELSSADSYCRYLATRHYENFSVASLLLPPELRLHLVRIYAFCRTTDDLGDESRPDALDRLHLWREQVEACFDRKPDPIHPVLLALRRTIAAFDLPRQPFFDLIQANVQDQTVTTYDTWDDLTRYCSLSAAPVGRLVLHVFEIQGPHVEELSDAVCIGLQLANFAQDVSVDRLKGRTYLPQSDLRASGTPGAIRATCDRAHHLLAAGMQLEDQVPLRLRIQLALYRLGGDAIVTAIRQTGYRTDRQRPHLSLTAKARLVPLAIRQATRRRAYVPAHPASQ